MGADVLVLCSQYELLNEPWAGLTDHPASDAKSLLPLYEVLVAAIRGVDVDHLIFFEPLATDSYLGILGDATDFPAGGIPVGNLTSLKAPKSPSRAQVTERADPNQVYTYHIYWPPQSGNISQAELEALKLYIALDWKGETKSLDHVQVRVALFVTDCRRFCQIQNPKCGLTYCVWIALPAWWIHE